MQPPPPCPALTCSWRMCVSALLLCCELPLGTLSVGFNYWFIFPTSYVALWVSKARHRLASESVSWCLETFLFFKTPFQDSLCPCLFCLSFYLLYLFLPFLKTMGCFSGCLMSSASIQKLFCGIYSALKCSFGEFVREKVVSLSYSSAILATPVSYIIFNDSFLSSIQTYKDKQIFLTA